MKSRRPDRVFRSAEGRRQILEAYDSLLRRVPFAYKETRIPTSFGETYVLKAGAADAPPLILFHGSSSNCASWFGDIGELARRFRGPHRTFGRFWPCNDPAPLSSSDPVLQSAWEKRRRCDP